MKINKLFQGALVVLALASCNDKMNYNEYNIYGKDYITKNFQNVGGFMTDIYNTVDYDFGNYSGGAHVVGPQGVEHEVASWATALKTSTTVHGVPRMPREVCGTACMRASKHATTCLDKCRDSTLKS